MNTINFNSKPKLLLFSIIMGLFVCGFLFFFFYAEFFNKNSEFDIPNKENNKIVAMLDKQIRNQIDNHTTGTMQPGYIESSRKHTIDYLSTISSIESYARYGVTSTQSRNYIQLKITFKDGTIVNDVYTGTSCSGHFEPCLLLKVLFNNGKTTKVYTNGAEKRGSPDYIINDLNTIIEKAISYDIDKNHDAYFPKEKTQKDFAKEWEEK